MEMCFGLNVGERECNGGRNGAFSGVEPGAKRRKAKLQTEAQRVSRFDAPSVTSATGMERSGHCRKGDRGDQWPVSGMEVALVTAAERLGTARDRKCILRAAAYFERLDRCS